jgi:hypothetical protein
MESDGFPPLLLSDFPLFPLDVTPSAAAPVSAEDGACDELGECETAAFEDLLPPS